MSDFCEVCGTEAHHSLGDDEAVAAQRLRSLDSIHLVTAERLREEAHELIIYDERMASAARHRGLRVSVSAPG